MSEFLLSYWWLVVIIIISIALITRSLVKLLIIFAIITIVFILFWQLLISPGFSTSSQCFVNDVKLADITFEKAKLMNAGLERNRYICLENMDSFNELVFCLNSSKKVSKLSFSIYSNLPWFKRTLSNVVNTDNENCTSYQVVAPNF